MNTFRLAASNRSGKAVAFGDSFKSLQECVSSIQVQNWKRRRHGLPEASCVKEYNKSGAVIKTQTL